jgi:DNA (cytosine-5)-methyltransferase 1
LDGFAKSSQVIEEILEHGLPLVVSPFIRKLLKVCPLEELPGKSIKDKRGGPLNIHSWDIGFKGKVSRRQREILNKMLTERRKHEYAEEYGIDWMDGMPLTLEMLQRIFPDKDLKKQLDDLVSKKYLKIEHPKRKKEDGSREQDSNLPKGYNIVSGKMSFEVNAILDPKSCAPTLVAMDMQHLYVVDGPGIRPLSLREGLRLFGYPDTMKFDIDQESGYDLLGNTVVVTAIKAVADRLIMAAM